MHLYIFFIIGCVISIFGYQVIVAYIIGLAFVFSIIVGIWIDSWKRKNQVLVESSKDRLIFDINGFPVEEDVNSLINIFADDEQVLASKFIKLFKLKLFFLTMVTAYSVYQLINIYSATIDYQQDYMQWGILIIGCSFTLYLIYRLINCLSILNSVHKLRWHIDYHDSDHQRYYAAYFSCAKASQSNYFIPLLALVFKI